MIASQSNNLLCVQPTKTGATSIYRWMMQHAQGELIRAHGVTAPKDYRDMETFIVARNPYDRAFSAYAYVCIRNGGNTHRFDHLSLMKENSFLAWLTMIRDHQRHLPMGSRPKSERVFCKQMPYAQHIYHDNNRIDRVIRFESLKTDFAQLPFRSKVPLPHANKFRHGQWKDNVGEQEILLINELYGRDFTLGGYTMITP